MVHLDLLILKLHKRNIVDLAKRSVDVKDLGLHIWDQWADDNGKIEGCYGDMVNRHVYMGTGKLQRV